jgi:hypothetical protein
MKSLASLCVLMITLILNPFIISTVASAKDNMITEREIVQAQETWGDGVIAIGKAWTNGGDYKETAKEHVDRLYAYQLGPVLFCPTKASKKQFRMTREGAIAYFVGGNKKFPEDKGFALQPWTSVRFENAGIFIHGDYAVAMGNYFFTTKEGKEVKVEYTFGYLKGNDGKLKVNLHHSSLPYPGIHP